MISNIRYLVARVSDLFEAYKYIQKIINGDCICRVDTKTATFDDEFVVGEVVEFIPTGEYENIFTGNIKDFLESFNNRTSDTGFVRLDNAFEPKDRLNKEEIFCFTA